jgi:hypothetical protein
MLDFHDQIPQIAPQPCRALIAQEYWYRGELVTEANVLFLRLADVLWHRFFIDTGVVFWKTVDEPDAPYEEGDHRYPHRDIGVLHGRIGKRLANIRTIDLPGGGELRLEFDDGKAIIVHDIDDCSTLAVEAGEPRAR